METTFKLVAEHVALAAELAATALIALGCIGALAQVVMLISARQARMRTIKDVWLRLAGWILLALEFTLAADIVRSSISPISSPTPAHHTHFLRPRAHPPPAEAA